MEVTYYLFLLSDLLLYLGTHEDVWKQSIFLNNNA